MDTSELYVKMCDCEEIQGKYEPEDGDYFEADGCVYVRLGRDVITSTAHLNELFTWLPRQDQLQEMYDNGQGFTHQNLEHFNHWYESAIGLFTSMEQLWLAFVMKEKFDKAWDGDKWVV